ncbi:MAG: FapA family protein [Lachnospira sp.]
MGGYVEGAVIRSNKDIVLNKGVNANGIGQIEAKGNISARFFENAIDGGRRCQCRLYFGLVQDYGTSW